MVLSARPGQRDQGTTSIGRGLYVERLTAGSTVAARKCLLITCKIIIPPPDSGDPPDGPPYFAKKHFPLTAGTHQLHLRTQGSASGQKKVRPPDSWDPPATSSQARKCVTVGTHLVKAYVALSFWSRTCMYIRSVCLQGAMMNRGCGSQQSGGKCFLCEIRWPVRWVPAVRGKRFFSQNTLARPVGPYFQVEE